MAEFSLPKNSKITEKGLSYPSESGGSNKRSFKIYRYDPDSGENPRYDRYGAGSGRDGADGPRRPHQDQERGRSHAHLPPLLPRGHLRLVRDEHGRQERPRLHHRDRGLQRRQGRDQHHAAAAPGRGEGSGAGSHPLLRAICLDQPVAADGDARPRARSGSSRRRTAPSWTASTSASCAPAARRPAPAIGGTPTSSSGRRSCSRPIAGWPTAATR